MQAGYECEKVDQQSLSVWEAFIKTSPQFTPFMRDDYLGAVGFTSDKYLVYKKGIPVAGLCVPISEDGKQEMVPYAPYQGILYRPLPTSHKAYREHLEAVGALLEFLDGKYERIFFCNHYTVDDMRAILWHHYHTPELGKYGIEVCYTAIKDIADDVLSGLSKGRKLDYQYSIDRYGLLIQNDCDSRAMRDFMELYVETFARQGIVQSKQNLYIVSSILKRALAGGYGMLRTALTQDGKPIDSIFILFDKMNAYYLFGANHPDYRKYGGGTLLLVEAMRELQMKGVLYFDFVGVNSPLRGDFKLSFGAMLKPYYVCSF